MNTLRSLRYGKKWPIGFRKPAFKILPVLWVILIAVTTSCKTESASSPWAQENALTIGQYLQKNQAEYSKFYTLLDRAKMLQTLYAYNPKGGDWSLFLPTDEAIDRLIEQHPQYANFEDLLKDTLFIKKLTRYHILKKRTHTNDFPDGAFVDSTLTGDRLVASFFSVNDNQLIKINHAAPIIKSNQPMTNGFIHVISEVLQPLQITGYDWLQQQGKYSILAKAMELSGISKKLTWDKYIIFAEPDSVFNLYGIKSVEDLVSRFATPGMPLTSKTNPFYQFTTYHLLKGEYYMNDFYWGTNKYITLSEQPITIDVGQDIRINTGVDTYVIGTSDSGGTKEISYIRPIGESCNNLTRTGPVHSISDLMYSTKLPKGVQKVY